MANKLKEVCELDSNRLIQSLSSPLDVVASRFLVSIDRNSKHELKGKMWISKEYVVAVSVLNCSPDHMHFSGSYFPYLLEEHYIPF